MTDDAAPRSAYPELASITFDPGQPPRYHFVLRRQAHRIGVITVTPEEDSVDAAFRELAVVCREIAGAAEAHGALSAPRRT